MPSLAIGRRQVPFVAASELNECGLACLAAISAFFEGEPGPGRDPRSSPWRAAGARRCSSCATWPSASASARAASRSRSRRSPQLALPAILHWDMNHFVVLERVTKSGIVVMDPAAGRLAVPWATVDTSFTGVALETRVSPGGGSARAAPQGLAARLPRAALAMAQRHRPGRRAVDADGSAGPGRAAADAALDRQRAAGLGRPPGLGAGDRLHPRRPAAGGDLGRPRLDARGVRRSRRLRAEGSLRPRPAPQVGALLPAPPQRRHPQPQPLGRHDPVARHRAAAAGAARRRHVDRDRRRHAARGAVDGRGGDRLRGDQPRRHRGPAPRRDRRLAAKPARRRAGRRLLPRERARRAGDQAVRQGAGPHQRLAQQVRRADQPRPRRRPADDVLDPGLAADERPRQRRPDRARHLARARQPDHARHDDDVLPVPRLPGRAPQPRRAVRDGAAPGAHQRRADRGRDGRRARRRPMQRRSGRSSSPKAPVSASR